jgi:hypothetical protein
MIRRAIRAVGRSLFWIYRFASRLFLATVAVVLCLAALIAVTNLLFGVPMDMAFRALDPASEACQAPPEGWDILADPKIGNDENLAVDRGRATGGQVDWEMRLRCSIQTHAVPGYQPVDSTGAPAGPKRPLTYDLAFLEFQENGDPYLLCDEDEYKTGTCDGTTFKPSRSGVEQHRGQLDALLGRLTGPKNYVVVFIHGWRNNADIGNANVADLRVYAAHAARFVADRCGWGDQRFCGMKTTAVFVGWRGARTDENRIRRPLPVIGDAFGTLAAIFTLFDRKPVSEAVAPSATSALRAIAEQIDLQGAFRQEDLAPCDSDLGPSETSAMCQGGPTNPTRPQSRMIVFGHSLGGNLLATGLEDQMVKLVDRHSPVDFLPPPLGNLVVLLNPASEAAKCTAVQEAVWRRIAMSADDMARESDFETGHAFFRDEQRPIVVSVTAARDWPPGGVWTADCPDLVRLARPPTSAQARAILEEYDYEAKRRARSIDYDWATYDLFPAFRFDFRPVASSLERFAQRHSIAANAGAATTSNGALADYPHLLDFCVTARPVGVVGWLAHFAAAALRVFPFMNTDVEQTHTIGQLDPPRSAQGITSPRGFSGRPVGTTHELVGWDADAPSARRTTQLADGSGLKEHALNYAAVVGGDAQCPRATGWLSKARAAKKAETKGSASRWDAEDLPRDARPALRFVHGFYPAHLPPITRANDPFWNLRALDNALAEHDGYMLSSFICAMQQLVLDDVTDIPPLPRSSGPPLAGQTP